MLSREYEKKIEIWINQDVDDGFGGIVQDVFFVKKIFAKIESGKAYKFENIGIKDFKKPIVFRVRGKNNIDISEKHFIRYKNKVYIIKAVENVNLEGIEINIYCDEL